MVCSWEISYFGQNLNPGKIYLGIETTPSPVGSWAGKHRVLMSKRACQGKPLSPMPPAGGTFWQCCRKVFGRFSTQDRVWQNCQTRSHLNIWQFRRQSIALKIGFGNLAEPDFHLHQGVVFNNRLSTLWGTKLYIIIRTRVSMLAPWRSRNPGQGASWDPHFSFLMRTQTVRIIC